MSCGLLVVGASTRESRNTNSLRPNERSTDCCVCMLNRMYTSIYKLQLHPSLLSVFFVSLFSFFFLLNLFFCCMCKLNFSFSLLHICKYFHSLSDLYLLLRLHYLLIVDTRTVQNNNKIVCIFLFFL